MRILEKTQKIPGGLMMIPLASAAVIHTFIPSVLTIGSPFTASFSSQGTMCVVGMMIFFTGIQIKPSEIPGTLKRGGVLILLKFLIGLICGLLLMHFTGQIGMLGISTLAWIACITSCNPGLYIALMNQYGDVYDINNYGLINLIGLPFIPICILGFAGGAGIDYMSILATMLPLIIGIILGCLDSSLRNFTKNATPILLPFMGFCLGSSIDLKLALQSVGGGIILFVFYMIINLVPLFLVDVYALKQRGHVAVSISCVAGLAMTVPALMAEKDASYSSYVDQATAQLAFVVVICAIVTPYLAAYIVKKRTAHSTKSTLPIKDIKFESE